MNCEIVSVKDGKFHRPQSTSFESNGSVFRDQRLMRCGRSLVPLHFFETLADADRHTGGRLDKRVCKQCEKKVSHLWRVPEVLKNGDPLHVYIADCFLVENSYERYHFNAETLSRAFGFRLDAHGEVCSDSLYLYNWPVTYRNALLKAARAHLVLVQAHGAHLRQFLDPFATATPCWDRSAA